MKGRFFGARKSLPMGGVLPPTPGVEVVDSLIGIDGEGKTRKTMGRNRVGNSGKGKAYSYDAGNNDIMGTVMLEVLRAEDLPRLRNSRVFHLLVYLMLIFGQ